MTLMTPAMMGSIRILFCSDYALLYYPCTPPVGFNASAASVISQAGISGFVVDASSTANELILSRVPAPVTAGSISIKLGGITNQASAGSSFARYHTYPTLDGSGSATDEGAVAYSINNDLSVSTEVPPYLTICVAILIPSFDCSQIQGNFLQMGKYTPQQAAIGQSQMIVATNAENGYTVRVAGQTMTSGNNTIPALASAAVSQPGRSQFGINLRANSDPSGGSDPSGPGNGGSVGGYGQTNLFKFNSGDVVAAGASTEDYRKYTVSYMVNVSRDQSPGVYSSSFLYIGLGNF